MTRRRTALPPRGPVLALVAAWALGSGVLAATTLAACRAEPATAAGLAAGAVHVLYAAAQSVALYYLLGFVFKSLHALALPVAPAPAPADRTPGPNGATAPTARPVAVLYLTAGDFDATALDSLLALRLDGPGRLIVHDDGNDPAKRRAIEAFADAHPNRAAWQVDVWHRPERRGGKAGAVNWVLERLEPRWELLLLCDSDSIALDPAAWRGAFAEFEDPAVAVVQFRNQAFVEPDEPLFQRRLARAIDVFDVFAAPQAAWGYLPFFGHNALVRTASLRALGGLTPGFFSDDLDFSARLTLAGQRILYRPDIAFGERHPADWLAFRKRSRKWAFGCMQVIRARARAVASRRGIPLAHRLGLLEFMGFYPAQALLVAGLAARHLVLPWLEPQAATGAGDAALGGLVVLGLLSPTLAWAVRERAFREWPALAASCVLVYGGSILATVRGVWDGFSTRGRPWIPTNLAVARPAVPGAAWAECALGLGLVAVPWWRGDGLVGSPASYLFAATFLLAPLTAAAYRERGPAQSSASATATALRASVALLALAGALVAACGAAGTARAGARPPGPVLSAQGTRLLLDGRPFQVRGVHYSPWLPGTGPGGNWPFPGPAVVDKDLDRIRDAGANAILVAGAPGWVSRHAWQRGLVTFYSFDLAWNDTSQAAFEAQSARVVAGVDSLAGTPGIVAWLLGHEVPDWVVADLGNGRVEGRLRTLAARVRERDPGRLLGHGNWPPTKDLDLSFLDLACFNLYPAWPYEVAVKGYGPYLREVLVPRARGRPLLVSEFGINSLEAGEARQADVITSCWQEIMRSPTAGGVVFEWSDEWWKNWDNPVAVGDYWKRRYDPTDAARHDDDPEEYYGIVHADRTPKPALIAVRRMWRGERAAHPWTPWAVLVALAALALLLLRGTRREAAPGAGTRSAAALAFFAALGALVTAAPDARAVSWSIVDSVTSPSTADSQFGWAVANGGDLDGDGRDEFVVGAHFENVGALTAAGAAYVFRGGWAQGTPPYTRLAGIQAHEHFGEAMAGGGDVDGDGHADLVVGAPNRSTGSFSANGAVDVFRGGALGAGPWATLSGEASDDWFGESVAIGDLDGDGVADIAVGAPYNDRGGSAAGAVFIYKGGATLSTTPWKILVGEAANDQFGWSIAYVGDVNGDGYGDLVVGARLHSVGFKASCGRAYLFHGGPAMSTTAAGTWDGEVRDDWFGNSVSAVGDVDGGGRADFLVGAPYNDRGGSAAGAAYLFRGEDPPGSAPLAIFVGESANAQLGWTVGGPGDVDGDGRPDVVAGARLQAGAGGAACGRVYLFLGGAQPSTVAAATADGDSANDWLGNSVAGAAQYFTLGHAAATAGEPYNDIPLSAAGRAYAYGLGALDAVGPGAPAAPARWTAAPNPARAGLRFTAPGATPGAVRIDVVNLGGRIVRSLAGTGAGLAWDLADGAGHRVPPGLYFARVRGGSGPAQTLRVAVIR